MKRAVAFDLGTSCGWALGSHDPLEPYDYGVFDLRPRRYQGGGMRFVLFRSFLNDTLKDDVGLVAFEEVRRHAGTDAAHIYGGLMATLCVACEIRSIPYVGIPVATIKRHATGKGNAPKEAMVAWALRARELGRVAPFDGGIGEDEADALALLDYTLKEYPDSADWAVPKGGPPCDAPTSATRAGSR